jgi:hypothetical protein
LPLFPDERGRICSKDAIARTIEEAARHLDVPVKTRDGSITGHTLRVTGAQGFAAAGLDIWAIQLLGRWGSSAVLGYVREAHLHRAEAWAKKVNNESIDLDTMVGELRSKIRVELSGQKLWNEALETATAYLRDREPHKRDLAEALAIETLSATALTTTPSSTSSACAASSSTSPPELDRVVSSEGILHKVLLGPADTTLERALTHCGWRYAKARATMCPANTVGPYKRLCSRCFADERTAEKAAFQASLQAADANVA